MSITVNKGQQRLVTQEVRQALRAKLGEEYPGYLEVEEKLNTIVKILTGLRILYSFFYLAMTLLYGMPVAQAVVNLIGPYFFYFWYTWMLRSGRLIAVMMMLFRGGSIVYGGVSTLEMSYWLPYPLIFMVTLAMVLEFAEAVFCIYVLFNAENAQAVRLNQELERRLQAGSVTPETLERMAAYRNEYTGEEDAEQSTLTEKKEESDGNESGRNNS